MSKSDFEVLMFKLYQENLRREGLSTDDFCMATALGIPESKVRNLKVKVELQYPDSTAKWQEIFIESVQNATCEDAKTVKVSIKDPNVKRNLEHMIDELRLYSETQLNPKLLQMRADHFVILCDTISKQLGNGGIDENALAKSLLESSAGNVLQTSGVLERLRNGAPIKELSRDIIAAAGKAGFLALLELIPFGGAMKKFMDTFKDKL